MWAKKNNYDLHGVNYFRMPDGRMILSTPEIRIPAEASLGRIMWEGRLEPAQKVFDVVFQKLKNEHLDKKPL